MHDANAKLWTQIRVSLQRSDREAALQCDLLQRPNSFDTLVCRPLRNRPENNMHELRRPLIICIALLIGAVSVSCSKTAEKPSVSTGNAQLLEYVSAETPYILANLVPLPDDVLDMLRPKADTMFRAYGAVIQALIDDQAGQSDDKDGEQEDAARIEALGTEIKALMSLDGLNSAGIDRTSGMVFYGDGLLPVLRLRLTDGDLMEQTISRLEGKAGEKMSTGKLGDHSYRYAGDDDARIVVAVIENDLVVTLVPANHSDELLKSVLGFTPPAKSMASSGELQTIAAQNDFEPYSLFLLDVTRLVSTFIDDQQGTNKEILALLEYDSTALSDVCKSEFREMAAVAPRAIAGYTEISTERFSSNLVVEFRKDIAAGLSELTAPVPGLGVTDSGFFSFGMSVNLLAAREFYAARLDAMEADPFECEQLADLQASVAKGRQMLSQPVMPVLYSIKGFLALVDAIEGGDMLKKQPPTSMDAGVLLSIDNPQAVLAMGAMFSPEIAGLNLQPDGKPVPLPVPPVSPVVSDALIAMTDTALAVSVGKGGEDRLESMLAADFAEPAPLMSTNLDSGRYYSFVADAMRATPPEDDKASPKVVAAMADMTEAMEGWFGRMAVDVNLTARGLEVPTTLEIAQED